jgi:hypothetical protein
LAQLFEGVGLKLGEIGIHENGCGEQ